MVLSVLSVLLSDLNQAGLGGLTTTALEDLTGDGGAKDLDEVANRMGDASDEFKAGVKQFTDATKGFFTGKSDKPEWWDQKPDWYKADTSTPRGDTTSSLSPRQWPAMEK